MPAAAAVGDGDGVDGAGGEDEAAPGAEEVARTFVFPKSKRFTRQCSNLDVGGRLL